MMITVYSPKTKNTCCNHFLHQARLGQFWQTVAVFGWQSRGKGISHTAAEGCGATTKDDDSRRPDSAEAGLHAGKSWH
jgi:hypothetical protein